MAKLSCLKLCGIYLLSFYYTILFCFQLLYYYLRGYKFWEVKERRVPPSKILMPEVGQHSHMQLKKFFVVLMTLWGRGRGDTIMTINNLVSEYAKIKMHYIEAGDKSKPLMVFMHGFPEFWYSWRHQLKEFHNDYWCVAVDMRGYGDTSKPPKISDYKVPDIAKDIKELVEALGRKKFIMIAHDWGGVVGWSFLDLYADMVEKYVIMNAPHTAAWDKLMEIDKTQFSKSWYVIFYQIPYFPELHVRMNDFALMDEIYAFGPNKIRNEEDIEAYKYTFSKPGALTPPINYYRNLFTTEPTVKRPVEHEPPGLFLFGDADIALSVAYVDIMPTVVPNLKSKIIKGGSHYVQQDDPIAVNKAMREFLNEK